MEENDFDEADTIMRLAFGTFLGLPDPTQFMGDADFIRTRFRADPPAALTAEVDGRVVGSNFALDWGTFGIFGPLTIHPEFWNRGVARSLLGETMKIFERWGTRHLGLFTFAESAKHVHLYQKFGFWPRYLTAVMSVRVEPKSGVGDNSIRYSSLDSEHKSRAIEGCYKLTNSIFKGLDLRKEILSVDRQNLGDTILLYDSANKDELSGMAICHCGAGTEAGSGTCYIKFAGISPTSESSHNFDTLLDACEKYSQQRNAQRLVAGVNTGRHMAYVRMLDRGFRADLQGVAMQSPNDPAYNLPDVYVIDDWR